VETMDGKRRTNERTAAVEPQQLHKFQKLTDQQRQAREQQRPAQHCCRCCFFTRDLLGVEMLEEEGVSKLRRWGKVLMEKTRKGS
jgi:hypothetical protein